MNHPLCIFRKLAISTLNILASEAILGENLSAADAAEIIAAVCRFALEGPDFFIEGMRASTTTWQSQMVMGQQDVCITVPYSSPYDRLTSPMRYLQK